MISGFNHNIRHKGKTYHVQTEDGGEANHSIVTHVYLGGVIMDTVRNSYQDLQGLPDRKERIRERMKAQHLEEIRKLIEGTFDDPGEGAEEG